MKRLICIGDSLTFGYGVARKSCWISSLSRLFNVEVINKGVNGDTTSGLLSRSFRDVLLNNADYVIIMAGTNDFLRGSSLNSSCNNLSELINESIQNSIYPIVACPMPVHAEMASSLWSSFANYHEVNYKLSMYRNWIIQCAAMKNFRYIDFHSTFYNMLKNPCARELYLDGIHPSEKGHKIMEQIIIESKALDDLLL